MPHSRRTFTAASAAALAAPLWAKEVPPLRAVVIGATGRGDYGHGMERVFVHRPDVRVTAIADPDQAGLAKALASAGAKKGYSDYREMLKEERPEIVVIASRHTDQHHAMAMDGLKAGANLLLEKPFVTTLAEGDEILALAQGRGLRVAVAHQTRIEPSVALLAARREELLGDLVEIHAWGKQDAARAGGEDMMVLGTHLFDLMRLVAGPVAWCQATVTQKGKPITAGDGRLTKDRVGPVAGDEVSAQFGFAGGTLGSFTSRHKLKAVLDPWGLELLGTKGVVRIVMDGTPRVYTRPGALWGKDGKGNYWKPLTVDERKSGPQPLVPNGHVADDLLVAIRQNREPQCSGANALAAVEMVMAVYQSALKGARVTVPLTDRAHPLKAV
jgi:predicted dehydrogenase